MARLLQGKEITWAAVHRRICRQQHEGSCARIDNPFFPKDRMETDMNVIDFRFRPNTPEIINGIKNSTMFKAACEVIGFDQRKPQPLDEIVADLDAMGVELGVITGRDAETALDAVGITVNKNTIPGEQRSPLVTSGIRVGSAAATTRGFDEAECERIGELIGDVVTNLGDENVQERVAGEVKEFLQAHPLYPEL